MSWQVTRQAIRSAQTADLVTTPEALTEQLVDALLRGLSVDKLYLPQVKS